MPKPKKDKNFEEDVEDMDDLEEDDANFEDDEEY